MTSEVRAAEAPLSARQSPGQPALLALTTEHFNLETARNRRSSLAIVTAGLLAARQARRRRAVNVTSSHANLTQH